MHLPPKRGFGHFDVSYQKDLKHNILEGANYGPPVILTGEHSVLSPYFRENYAILAILIKIRDFSNFS